MTLLEKILALRTQDPDEFILACKNAVSMVENERTQELMKANYNAALNRYNAALNRIFNLEGTDGRLN
jgi:hypothetical protein